MKVEGGDLSFNREFFKELQRITSENGNGQVLTNAKKEIEKKTEGLQKVDSEVIQKTLEEIRKKLDYLSKYLKIEIDDQLEIPVVKIIEKETNRVIRQIPPEYLLELMKRIDLMLGILLNERV